VYLCAYVFGYRYLCDVAPIGVKVCTTVDLSSGHKVNSTLAYRPIYQHVDNFHGINSLNNGHPREFLQREKNPTLSFPSPSPLSFVVHSLLQSSHTVWGSAVGEAERRPVALSYCKPVKLDCWQRLLLRVAMLDRDNFYTLY